MRTITTELPLHPLAHVFPAMDQQSYERLRDDIRVNGQMEEIWLLDGQIIDGRHRYRACRELGLPVKARDYDGDDPATLVKSHNLVRRHLSASQSAMAAARLSDWYAEQAKDRQRAHGGTAPGKPKKTLVENLPQVSDCKKARDQAGEDFGVSGRTVEDARLVLRAGVPELVAMIDAGKLKLNTAKQIATLNERRQREVVSLEEPTLIRAAMKKAKTASEACKKRVARTRASSAQSKEAPPAEVSVLPELLFGLERLSDAVRRINKPIDDVLNEWSREMPRADEFTRRRWESLQETIDLVEQLRSALDRRRLQIVSNGDSKK